jgi:hypothetical protein
MRNAMNERKPRSTGRALRASHSREVAASLLIGANWSLSRILASLREIFLSLRCFRIAN